MRVSDGLVLAPLALAASWGAAQAIPKLSAESKRVLKILADAPEGIPASRLQREQSVIASLLIAGYVMEARRNRAAGRQVISFVRFHITDAGRVALER